MKRTIDLLRLLLFTSLILCNYSAVAQQNDDGSSHIAKGYEIKYSEKIITHSDLAKSKNNNYPLVPYCSAVNPVEFGNSIPYPTAVVPLEGHFFTFQGKADWVPYDPGQAGKQRFFGIDSDRDCVRDDIERLIARLLPSANQKKARKYIFEYARWREEFLCLHSFKDPQPFDQRLQDISRNLYKSAECFRRQVGDNKSKEIIDIIFSKIHNTFPRSYRYLENNAMLGGWSTREKIPVTCP